jgi:hypothetical protein
VVASRLDRFTPGETASGTLWMGGWVGLKVGLDDVKKMLAPTGNHTTAVQPVARLYTD